MNMPEVNNGFLYNLLVNPRYRIWRHILLIFGLVIISLNQAYSTYREYVEELGNNIYVISLGIIIIYAAVIYYNLYVLVPRYLLSKKYVYYVVGMFFSILVLLLLQDVFEYIVHIVYKISPGEVSLFNPENSLLIDTVTSLATYGVCVSGISVTSLLKQWMFEDSRISKLENDYVKSEVEELKNQITPSFLFNILNRTGVLAKNEPDKASGMLMKLSQILRYQLYDSSRDKVVLSSEIEFLRNYLNLQQMYYPNFRYEIEVKGDINHKLLPPLLFIPFVQYSIDNMIMGVDSCSLHLLFKSECKLLTFVCKSDEVVSLDNPVFKNIKRRLSLLFPGRYILYADKKHNEIVFKLNLD